jgi:hypothetical protein
LIQFRLSAMKNGKLKKESTYHGKHFQPFLIGHFFPIVISSKNEQTLIKYSFTKFQDTSTEEDLELQFDILEVPSVLFSIL